MIVVYVSEITPRLRYLFEEFLPHQTNLSFSLTCQWDVFESWDGAKFVYTSEKPTEYNGFWVYASPLLFDKGVVHLNIEIDWIDHIPVFFKSKKESLLEYDYFSAIFFMITRYEEYLPNIEKDAHGRYLAINSVAFKHNFLHIPVVDYWILAVEDSFGKIFGIPLKRAEDKALYLTIDVDYVYAFKGKPWGKNILRWAWYLISGQWRALQQLTGFLWGKGQDPFDFWALWSQMIQKYKAKAFYFIHVGLKGKYDPGFQTTAENLQVLQNITINDRIDVGLHPSYEAFYDDHLLFQEKQRLENILQRAIKNTRQHFLKIQLPKTYHRLMDIGLNTDFTMGYPEVVGFRAGTSRKYLFYDLQKEASLPFYIFPFCITDIAIFIGLDASAEIKKAHQAVRHLKKTSSPLCILSHSHALMDRALIQDYFERLEKLIYEYTSSAE